MHYYYHRINNLLGSLGLPSLNAILGICFMEKEAAASNTSSNALSKSVRLYSTLTGYSDSILLLTILSPSSSRRRSVRTFGDIPSIFSMNRLNCVLPLRISLMIKTVHLFPIILIWKSYQICQTSTIQQDYLCLDRRPHLASIGHPPSSISTFKICSTLWSTA